MSFRVLRPAIFSLEPELAHRVAIAGLKILPKRRFKTSDILKTQIAGIEFPNPMGVAAGFDKNAEVPDALLGLGFGFAEVGSITPRPQYGNPRPRLFRLREDRGVINRMGFNNLGANEAIKRLQKRNDRPGIVGINVGANKDSNNRVSDYVTMTRLMAPYATYLAINVSSPNTPGLRNLQDEVALTELLDAVTEARDQANKLKRPPIFLKVAPDLEIADIEIIARIAVEKALGALIVSNTSISRPTLLSRQSCEVGGLSGAPIRELATQRVRDFRAATGAKIPIVGVGGIFTAEDALERIKAGASLVQLYSAMVYEGPAVGSKIVSDLKKLLEEQGYSNVSEAVGSERPC